MYLKSLNLQNFRSYKKAQFSFDPHTTVVIGPNAAGKTNLVEAINLLATGKSFRTGKEKQLIAFEKPAAHLTGEIGDESDESVAETLSITISQSPTGMLVKKYLVNGVPRRRSTFAQKLPVVLFNPMDLDIISGQPGERRRFLNEVLEQTDPEYDAALTVYTKALRQRNALLEYVQKTGRRDPERFAYWDDLLIKNGDILTRKRDEFIAFINSQEKALFPFMLSYDKSIMSRERLLQYKDVEVGAGVTLVGPQRDDFSIQSFHPVSQELEDVKYFCSRGQQRLVTLELKKSQISYFKDQLHVQPLLVLDDIFSELDSVHIEHVLHMAHNYQTIITTTHKEFIMDNIRDTYAVIELGKEHKENIDKAF